MEKAAAASDRLVKNLREAERLGRSMSKNAGGGGGSSGSGVGSYGVGSSGNNLLSQAFGSMTSGVESIPGIGKGLGFAARTYGGMINAMPNVNPVIDRAAGYYQAAISGGVANRKVLAGTTFSALSGGLTSYGSDATVSNMLLGRGMNYSATPGSTYMQTLQGVKSAAQYLNMPNERAADAIENLTSGPTSASMLMTYGIFTADPTTGKEKTQGQIFEEIFGRLTAGRGKMTTEQTMEELRRGALGSSIRNAPLTEDQKQMFAQFAIEKSKGRTMDLSDPEAMKKMIAETTAGGNANPLKPTQDIYTSETGRAANFEEGYIKGMQNTADILKVVNPLLDQFTGYLAEFQSTLSTMNSTQGGNFVINTVSDAWKTIFGGGGGMGMSIASASSSGGSGGPAMGMASAPSSPGKAAFAVGSGGGSNNSSAQQLRLIRPAGGNITCQFGVVDKEHPNGHRGIDYGVSQGSSVIAAAAGTVSYAGNNGTELGYQVWVDHGNGFVTGYCHLSTRVAQQGSRVEQGQEIAKSGNSGTATTGAHLHFCLKKNGSYTDPNPYLSGGGGTSTPKTTKSTGDTAADESNPGAMPVGDPGASGIVSVSSTGVSGGSISPVSEAGLATVGGKGFSKVGDKMSSQNKNSVFNPAGTRANQSSSGTDTGGGSMGLGMAGGIATAVPGNSLGESMDPSSTGSAGAKNQVVINLQIGKATDDEARRFASVVKDYLENDRLMFNMGRQ
jgi:hypothetical protein